MASKGQKFNNYTVEFRQTVVDRYFKGESRGSLSREYGISENTINTWIRVYRNRIPIGQQKRGRIKDEQIDYKESVIYIVKNHLIFFTLLKENY